MMKQHMKAKGYSLFELLIPNTENYLVYLECVTQLLLTHIKIYLHTIDI
jgi:hypothetical protein